MASLKDQMEEKDIELQSVSDRGSLLEYKKREIEEQLAKTRQQLKQERDKWAGEKEENQQEMVAMNHVIQHLRNELEEKKTTKKRNATTTSDMRLGEILKLKQEIKSLTEERDNLSSQLLRQGQLLVAETPQSLADELKDAPKADIMKALKDQEDLNVRLKAYIEGLLVTILNSHPELLEVKSPTHRR
jgi:Rab11 family-interacting protein 3/4